MQGRRYALALIDYVPASIPTRTCLRSIHAEVGNGFQCPENGDVATGAFSRHAHPEDCRRYYVCMNGNAREYGCPLGTVFKIGDDDVSGFCTDPEEVEGW